MHTFSKYFFAIMVIGLLVRVKRRLETTPQKREPNKRQMPVFGSLYINMLCVATHVPRSAPRQS